MESWSYIDRFRRKWLVESPKFSSELGKDTYTDLLLALDTTLLSGFDVVDIGGGLKKLIVNGAVLHWLELNGQAFYWVEVNDQIDIIAQFTKTPAGLFINVIGKKPDALTDVSDFYQMVVKDAGKIMFSGKMIDSQGLAIWKNFLASGRKLLAYNENSPANYIEINSDTDFDNYVGADPKFQHYRLVLAESNLQLTQAKSSFDLLRTYMMSFCITNFNNTI